MHDLAIAVAEWPTAVRNSFGLHPIENLIESKNFEKNFAAATLSLAGTIVWSRRIAIETSLRHIELNLTANQLFRLGEGSIGNNELLSGDSSPRAFRTSVLRPGCNLSAGAGDLLNQSNDSRRLVRTKRLIRV